jgi:hypothetical protein
MRKVVIALTVLAALGLALPVVSSANAESTKTVIIKRGGHHDRDRHAFNRHRADKVVIIKKHRRHDY